MGAIASLDRHLVEVAPGGETSLEIKVKNDGSVVDEMSISILGAAAEWTGAEPPSLSLFPGAEGTATITFRPPRRASIPAGAVPFGVRVVSNEDPQRSTVEEGTLRIGAFTQIGVELQPLSSRGARGGRHDLAIDNLGNVPLNADITGVDPSEALRFDVRPPAVVVDPGAAGFAEVEVRPRRRLWRGRSKSHGFSIQVGTAGQPPVPVSGTFVQESLLPSWLIPALLVLGALLLALLVLWFLILEPSVLSTAEERAAETAEEVAAPLALEAADKAAAPLASQAAAAAQAAAEDVLTRAGIPLEAGSSPTPTDTPAPTPTPTATPTPTPATLLQEGDPAAGRLAGSGSPTPISPTPGKTLYVTDLVFSNPEEETGEVRLRRNGSTLLLLRLENFRDLDFHFVTPIVFEEHDTMDLWCEDCTKAALFFSGYER